MFSWDIGLLALDLRAVLRLVVLSVALVLVGRVLFRRNAPSRRQFLLWAAALLIALPWFIGGLNLAIPIGVVELPRWSLQHRVPTWVVWPVLAISLVGLIHTAVLAHAQRRQLMLLPLLDDVRLQRLAAPLLQPLGLARMPSFRQYQANVRLPQAPFASSKSYGQIVLPTNYQQLDDMRLRAIITHELVHLARRDDWGRLVLRTLTTLYWFLPWLRGLERDYLDAMEHSCDDRAADFFGPSLSYMEAVVGAVGLSTGSAMEQSSAISKRVLPPGGRSDALRSMHPLLRRVLRFGDRREFDADTIRVAGYLLLTLATGVTLAALQPVTKAQPASAVVAAAGLALPASGPRFQEPIAHTPIVRVTVAQPLPQNQPTTNARLQALEQPLPIYPGAALRAEVEGEVWVDYKIAMDGSVVSPHVVHSVPAGLFEKSALTTVRRTRYQHLSHYARAPLNFARASPAGAELRVRQRFRYQLQPSY